MRPWHAYHACMHKPMGRIPPRQPSPQAHQQAPSTPPGDLARPDTPSVYAIGPGVMEKCTILCIDCNLVMYIYIYTYIYIYVYIINIYMNVT